MRIGILSDTHGLLRPEVLPALQSCEHILHAGDVGQAAILIALRQIAPVTAIRGNVDRSGLCGALPETEMVTLGGRVFYLLHNLDDLDINPRAAGVSAVIYGHTHEAAMRWKDDVLYLNPGSIGPRRFHLPVTLAILECDGVQPNLKLTPEIITLYCRGSE